MEFLCLVCTCNKQKVPGMHTTLNRADVVYLSQKKVITVSHGPLPFRKYRVNSHIRSPPVCPQLQGNTTLMYSRQKENKASTHIHTHPVD